MATQIFNKILWEKRGGEPIAFGLAFHMTMAFVMAIFPSDDKPQNTSVFLGIRDGFNGSRNWVDAEFQYGKGRNSDVNVLSVNEVYTRKWLTWSIFCVPITIKKNSGNMEPTNKDNPHFWGESQLLSSIFHVSQTWVRTLSQPDSHLLPWPSPHFQWNSRQLEES